MLTDDKYQKLVELKMAGKVPPHRDAEVSSAISEYQNAHRSADFGEHGSGPTGIDAMQAAGLPTQEAADQKAATIEQATAENPQLVEALHLKQPSQVPSLQSGASDQELSAHVAQERALYDNNLPNMSKRIELKAPPEWHPPTPVDSPDPFDSVWGKLSQVKKAMPDWAGGDTIHYVEPSIEQFQYEMAPILGPDVVGKVHQGDKAFEEWADAKYIDALQKAQAEGKPIVRDAFKPGAGGVGGMIDAIPGALTKAGKYGKAAAIGADKSLTGGIAGTGAYLPHSGGDIFEQALNGPAPGPSSMEDMAPMWNAAQDAKKKDELFSPLASTAGGIAGAISPMAVGNKVVGGLTKAAGALPGRAGQIAGAVGGSAMGRIAMGAPAGFVGAAATDLAGSAPEVAVGNEDVSGAMKRAGEAGFWGAPLGIIGSALGEGIAAEGRNLRKESPLGEAERGGARMRPLRGVDMGEANKGLEARARSEGAGYEWAPDVPGMVASDLAQPFKAGADKMQADLIASAHPLRDFEAKYASDFQPVAKTVRAILKAKEKLLVGGQIPSGSQGEAAKLDALLGDAVAGHAILPPGHGPDVLPAKSESQLESELSPTQLKRQHQFNAAIDDYHSWGERHYGTEAADRVMREGATTPITPQAVHADTQSPKEATGPYKPPPEEVVGEFANYWPTPDAEPSLWRGQKLGRVHELRRTYPDLTVNQDSSIDLGTSTPGQVDLPAELAARLGLIGPGGKAGETVRVSPKELNPDDLRKLVRSVRQTHERGSLTKEPFPDYDAIKRALHQDRDSFTGSTEAIPSDMTEKLPSGETVRGYSAATAKVHKESLRTENLLRLLGLDKVASDAEVSSMDLTEPLQKVERVLKNYGKNAPEVDDAIRQMAEATWTTPTVESIKQYIAMKTLEQQSRMGNMLRLGGAGEVTSLSGRAMRLRADPLLQGSLPGVRNAGTAAAASNQRADLGVIPPKEDDATLEEIRRAMAP